MRYSSHFTARHHYQDSVKVAVYSAAAPTPESQSREQLQTAIVVSLMLLSGLIVWLGS